MNDLDRDIIEALRQQVMEQNNRILQLEGWIRSLNVTPHAWLQREIREILSE